MSDTPHRLTPEVQAANLRRHYLPWNNPIFLRFARSRLRPATGGFWLLATLIVTAFTFLITFLTQQEQVGRTATEAARESLAPLLIIQGVILFFMGTGRAGSGMVREKIDGTLDYQRLAPMTPVSRIIGYLFGLPVREYAMFAVTLPFVVFVVILADIPLLPLAQYYVVFAMSTLLYHATGLTAGMISSWRWAARAAQILVVLLYWVLPGLSNIGIVFFEFLTVRPAFGELMFAIYPETLGTEWSVFSELRSVLEAPFFTTMIPGFLFSLIVQALLFSVFLTIVRRKWTAEGQHSLGKVATMVVFASFQILIFANVWPYLTGAEALYDSETASPIGLEALIVAQPFLLLLVGGLLAGVATPNLMRWQRGMRRAHRHGGTPAFHTDDAGARITALVLAALAAAGAWIFGSVAYASGGLGELDSPGLAIVINAGVIALVLLTFQANLQWRGRRVMWFLILILWILPLLTGMVVAAAISAGEIALRIGAISPILQVVLASMYADFFASEFVDRGLIQSSLAIGVFISLANLVWAQIALWRRDQAMRQALADGTERSQSLPTEGPDEFGD